VTELSDFVIARLNESGPDVWGERDIVERYLAAREANEERPSTAHEELREALRSIRMLAAKWEDHDDFREDWSLTQAERTGEF
jgi:uncharacterized protein YhaN